MATSNRRVRRSRAQWQGLIERAAHSPLSIGAFCGAEGISTASFYSWRKRLGAVPPGAAVAETTAEDGAFLELGVLGGEAAGPAPWDIELDLGAGLVLRLRRR
jgi:putative transposase